ncbi:MAG: alpha-L-rhamnosidase, partial [Sphingomonadales bacterium]|nr:alpha-L-rhamnosidase [Sphingomonadales bacterium]
MTPAAVGDLRVCGLDNPLALGDLAPRFAWQVNEGRQTAYRIRVARNTEALGAGDLLWDSGRVASPRQFDVAYGGPAIAPGGSAVWQVEVWSTSGKASRTSAVGGWETGLAAWQGEWLAAETQVAAADRSAGLNWISGSEPIKAEQERMFRWTFDSAQEAPAELCIAAHETISLWLNGEQLAAPSDGPAWWTQMATYPLRLRKGRNVIAASVRRKVGFGVPQPCLV